MAITKIYIASPFFNDEETEVLSKAETILRNRGFEVFSPREHEVRDETAGTSTWSQLSLMTAKALIGQIAL